jgi:ribosomal protein S18 acetylase RimI-like enzyme
VSIGVKPNARGQGVGEKLMRALIGEAARGGLGLNLSVRSENPARRLYERLGSRHSRFRCHEPRWRHVDRHDDSARATAANPRRYL